jgi:hypothetical protein
MKICVHSLEGSEFSIKFSFNENFGQRISFTVCKKWDFSLQIKAKENHSL